MSYGRLHRRRRCLNLHRAPNRRLRPLRLLYIFGHGLLHCANIHDPHLTALPQVVDLILQKRNLTLHLRNTPHMTLVDLNLILILRLKRLIPNLFDFAVFDF